MKSLVTIILPLAVFTFAFAQKPAPNSYSISGTVVNAITGEPIPEARVRLALPQERETAEVMITTDDGHFSFTGLSPQKYVLVAGKPGYLLQGFNEHENYSTAIAVGSGLETNNLVFRLQAESVLSGQITDDQSEVVADAQIVLFQNVLRDGQRTMIQRSQANTDDRGIYSFGGLAPGSYFIAVSARPWYMQYVPVPSANNVPSDAPDKNPPLDLTFPITYYPGTSDPAGAAPVVMAGGEHLTADLRLSAVPSVHLRMKVPDLTPNQGFSAVLTPIAPNGLGSMTPVPVQTSFVGPGEVELTGIPPGQYHLQFVVPGRKSVTYEQDINANSNLEIDAETSSFHPDISGIVKLQAGSLGPGSVIVLRNPGAPFAARTQIAESGEFRLDRNTGLAPGKYDVRVLTPTRDAMVQSVAATGARVSGRSIEITGSNPVRLTVTMARGLARITGTAVAAKGAQPFAGAMILLVPDNLDNNSALIRRDQSDSDGTFTLPSVLPGHYTLLALQNGWDLEWMNPAVLKPFLKDGQSVVVQENGSYNLQVQVH